jgi:Spy/CpxP family protein refolding chaperone
MMATAATEATRRPPRHRLVAVALVLSLALNVCFAAGAAWTRLHPPAERMGIAERFQAIAAQLDLAPPQRASFEQYSRSVRARAEAMHSAVDPLLAEAWSEMAKSQPDQARIDQLFDDAAAQRRALQRDMTSLTIAFLATLSPEQRTKFIELGREHFGPRGNGGRRRGGP